VGILIYLKYLLQRFGKELYLYHYKTSLLKLFELFYLLLYFFYIEFLIVSDFDFDFDFYFDIGID
jgi:hypothetical protein